MADEAVGEQGLDAEYRNEQENYECPWQQATRTKADYLI